MSHEDAVQQFSLYLNSLASNVTGIPGNNWFLSSFDANSKSIIWEGPYEGNETHKVYTIEGQIIRIEMVILDTTPEKQEQIARAKALNKRYFFSENEFGDGQISSATPTDDANGDTSEANQIR